MSSWLVEFLFLASLFVPALMCIIGMMIVLASLIADYWGKAHTEVATGKG